LYFLLNKILAFEKILVAMYLKKLSLFKLMPFDLLEAVAGKIETESYK